MRLLYIFSIYITYNLILRVLVLIDNWRNTLIFLPICCLLFGAT